jgi:hypothetical protein
MVLNDIDKKHGLRNRCTEFTISMCPIDCSTFKIHGRNQNFEYFFVEMRRLGLNMRFKTQ